MAATLEELTERVERLERQISSCLRKPTTECAAPTMDPNEPDLFRLARENQAALSAAFDKFCLAAGITCAPIPAEQLQRQIAASLLRKGIRPEDNSFSRELIAMREE